MFKRKPLWLATATALGVASIGSMLANPAFAQEQGADEEELLVEEVVVTGSRIKRTMDIQSQEIITFTAEDMQISGDISVSDALRSSTMNSFGSFRESSGNSAQSAQSCKAGCCIISSSGHWVATPPTFRNVCVIYM